MYEEVIGKSINELTILDIFKEFNESANRNYIIADCKCSCGNLTRGRLHTILANKKKSCGICLKLKHLNHYRGAAKKYTSIESAARCVWNNFYKKGSNLTFDNFYKISQLNCYYCGVVPQNRSVSRTKERVVFVYSGLDRINNSLPHNYGNVVACCYRCNWMKSDRDASIFIQWARKIKNNQGKPKLLQSVEDYNSLHRAKKSSVFSIWRNKYNEKDISKERFFNLSQQNCYYCGITPQNRYNKFGRKGSIEFRNNGNFVYNGLDRTNSDLPHTVDNVVPCCKYCNRAKLRLSVEDFYQHIDKVVGAK